MNRARWTVGDGQSRDTQKYEENPSPNQTMVCINGRTRDKSSTPSTPESAPPPLSSRPSLSDLALDSDATAHGSNTHRCRRRSYRRAADTNRSTVPDSAGATDTTSLLVV